MDPKVSQMACSFNHSSIQCDCWHWFAFCSVVKRAPQCLCLAWANERSGVVTPLGYAIQLLLHCFGCLLGVLWCLVYEPIIYQCEKLAGSILVQICQTFGADIKEDRRERWSKPVDVGQTYCREIAPTKSVRVILHTWFGNRKFGRRGRGEDWEGHFFAVGCAMDISRRTSVVGVGLHSKQFCLLCMIPGAVRLVSANKTNEGLLEHNVNGIWTPVCGDGFNTNSASVVCRELGFPPWVFNFACISQVGQVSIF